MYIARVLGKVISTEKYECYKERKLMFVQKLDLNNQRTGAPTIAVDYVGAGEGDIVFVGSAPGLASTVFNIPPAPLRELIMGIVDNVETTDGPTFGHNVAPDGPSTASSES